MLFFGEGFGGGAVIVVVSVYMFLFVAFVTLLVRVFFVDLFLFVGIFEDLFIWGVLLFTDIIQA